MDVDFLILSLLIFILIFIYFFKFNFFIKKHPPCISFSQVNLFNTNSWRVKCFNYPTYLHCFSILCLILALINPKILSETTFISKNQPLRQLSKEGLAIYIVLDQSGSMATPLESKNNQKKIDFLKEVTKQFIIDHPNDLIGLISFARIPRVLVPLTLDQNTLLKKLGSIDIVQKPEDDGTAIGYAIYKTANLMVATRYFSEEMSQEKAPPFTIKSSVMIIVSDGFQDPNRLDYGHRLRTIELDEAAAYAKKEDIHLYIINIDPSFSSESFEPHRRQLERMTKNTGGQFYLIKTPNDLKNIYQSIHELEKGEITLNPASESVPVTFIYLYPYFIGLGLIALFIVLFLETWVLKTIP